MKSQHTSREVYDRIRWDARYDPRRFWIGYDAHAAGMKEVPFLSFVPGGDIPWHRVWYFREGDRIVWDRRTRVDEVFARRDPREARGPAPARWPGAGFFTPACVYRFTDGEWREAEFAPDEPAALEVRSPSRVLTWNVLDGAHEGDAARTPERLAVIPRALAGANADVIALQEVTPALWEALLASAWVREGFWVTGAPGGHAFSPHGVALLSREPVAWAGDHAFRAGRRAVALALRTGAGPAFVVALHLPSNYARGAVALRAQWLSALVREGVPRGTDPAREPTCVLLGDFNADDRELSAALDGQGFVDAFAVAAAAAGETASPPPTYEPARNALAALASRSGQPARLDRVFVRSGAAGVRVASAELFAHEPAEAPAGGPLWLSDHAGVRCVLEAEGMTPQGESPHAAAFSPPVHTSALAWVPPEEAWGTIQAVRAEHDRGYTRWPPHVNLLYGFVPEAEFPRALELLRPACEQLPPCTITLAGASLFEHRGGFTVYLTPASDPPDALARWETALRALFPGCTEQTRHGVFTPHLTVGQFPREREANARALLAALRRDFAPVQCDARDLSLLARGPDTPFAVRARVPLGRDARAGLLDWLDERCAAVLYGRAGGPRPVVHAFGAYALGEREGGDLDALALGPPEVEPALFFEALRESLAREPEVRGLRVAGDARVPRLLFERAGVRADVCYARRPAGLGERGPEFATPAMMAGMDAGERRALEGVLQARALRRRAEGTVGLEVFLETLGGLKRWARARGVYGNAWGYPGGVAWAVMLGRACGGMRAGASSEEVLRTFFEVFAAWDWSRPVALEEGRAEPEARRAPMVVLTSSEPPRNATRNVTRATARVVREEISRALEWTGRAELFAPWRPAGDRAALVVRANAAEALRACAGWLEGHALGFVLGLEATGCAGVRPVPGLVTREGEVRFEVCCEGGGPEGTERAERALHGVRATWEGWEARPAGAALVAE